MSKLEEILEHYPDEEFLTMDGHDDAIIGVDEDSMRIIYSKDKIITSLEQNMSAQDALEFFDFNIARAHMGDMTPIICNDYFL